MTAAPFISFEGPEGAGKTTQLGGLAERLRELGHNPLETREPGGTPEGEALRGILLDPEMRWSPVAELLLMNAARDAHMRQVILPALAAGRPVLCDRFAHSTRAYQGHGGGVPETLVATVEEAVVSRAPDLILIFDLPSELGLSRAAARGRADRFEEKGRDYHERVRTGFLAIAEASPSCVVIDAGQDRDTVAQAVWRAVLDRTGLARP